MIKDLNRESNKNVKKKMKVIMRNREKIATAFIAETGCKPSECIMVERHLSDGSIGIMFRMQTKMEKIVKESTKFAESEAAFAFRVFKNKLDEFIRSHNAKEQ